MTDTTIRPEVKPGPKGLAGRLMGVVFSPRAAYADIVARPRVLGALLVVLVLTAGASVAFFSTEVGRNAMLEQQDRAMQQFGVRMSDAQYAQMQARMQGPAALVFTSLGTIFFVPFLALVASGIIIAVFNAVLGGDATFKQIFALVVHAQFLSALQSLFVFPLDYAKESLSSPTSLAVFLPFLDEGSFAARALGSIDFFRIWFVVNLAIGIGVLYKRRTAPIATTLLAIYGVIALVIGAVSVALSGA